jgi:creatinine amidohydrolase
MSSAFLEDLTWAEAAERFASGAVVLVPIGAAAKEHGLHLPLGTDWHVVRELARRVAESLPVVVAPVVGFGYYPAFAAYPGSQHLRAETFEALLTDIIERLLDQGARKIAFVNNGVSTETPLTRVVAAIPPGRSARLAIFNTRELGRDADRLIEQRGGGHADERETSVMLTLAPAAVRLERAQRAEPSATPPFSPDPASPGYNPTGATGDPTLATAEKGRRILEAILRDLIARLTAAFPELSAR